jgi:hypothetical protein
VPPFRDRLVATLRAIEPILQVDGVMIVGSEVPNLLEAGAAATLVISQDVDVLVPLASHDAVRAKLATRRACDRWPKSRASGSPRARP